MAVAYFLCATMHTGTYISKCQDLYDLILHF